MSTRCRPCLATSAVPHWLSSFLSWALTAEVERDRRSAAWAKLPHSMPVTKLRRASRSSPGKRFSIIILIFRMFILNVVILGIILWHRERQASTGPATSQGAENVSGAERNKKADKEIIGLLQVRLTAGRQAPPARAGYCASSS
ncbi:hypothetical protein BN1200_400047 [Klebsiella variicola]|nr:hypothetical protein BN1200_400047 [Klebsiella variicola]CTQ17494.1 exported hypothetical protein [Klebsiella variicola]CTQ18973.1 exported hypothetical protein [Klebsiella variicola]CTQ25409.1 hypothetical protein BN1200_740002 [Klebsiella variicola]